METLAHIATLVHIQRNNIHNCLDILLVHIQSIIQPSSKYHTTLFKVPHYPLPSTTPPSSKFRYTHCPCSTGLVITFFIPRFTQSLPTNFWVNFFIVILFHASSLSCSTIRPSTYIHPIWIFSWWAPIIQKTKKSMKKSCSQTFSNSNVLASSFY